MPKMTEYEDKSFSHPPFYILPFIFNFVFDILFPPKLSLRFLYLFENYFIFIRILEYQDIQIHLICHRIKVENKHHNNGRTIIKQISKD